MDLYNNRPGPLNEHDYYSTRETNDSSLRSPNEKQIPEEIIPSEGLQVNFTSCIRNDLLFCYRVDYFSVVMLIQCSSFQIDNSSAVLTKIARLYAEKLMNDVCLVVGGKDFLAHRLILCASSEVFHVCVFKHFNLCIIPYTLVDIFLGIFCR